MVGAGDLRIPFGAVIPWARRIASPQRQPGTQIFGQAPQTCTALTPASKAGGSLSTLEPDGDGSYQPVAPIARRRYPWNRHTVFFDLSDGIHRRNFGRESHRSRTRAGLPNPRQGGTRTHLSPSSADTPPIWWAVRVSIPLPSAYEATAPADELPARIMRGGRAAGAT